MSHVVWCQACPRPAVCEYCGTDYPSQRAADIRSTVDPEVLVRQAGPIGVNTYQPPPTPTP